MSFFVIQGTFHVKGYAPDGDSVRFKARNVSHWGLLGGPSHLAINSQAHVQLRLEGIDTLESHFSAPEGEVHQPLTFANAATDFFLAQLGITGVVWNNAHRQIVQANDGASGYILTRKKDKNGRPISFVFTGNPQDTDGADVFLSVDRLKTSLNYRSLAAGHAFPIYYTGLFSDLREAMTVAVQAARAERTGVFAADKTNSGVRVNSLQAITDQHVLLPKLFRRLAEFIAGDPTPDLAHFPAWLEQRNEQVLLLRTQNFTHFDNVVEVNGQVVKLTELPESLVFRD